MHHAFRRAICEMESIADILCGVNMAYPDMDLSGLRQRIYARVEELEADIHETREVYDTFDDSPDLTGEEQNYHEKDQDKITGLDDRPEGRRAS